MIYNIWLSLTFGFGSAKAKELIELFGSARAVYDEDIDNVLKSCEFSQYEYKKFLNKSLSKSKKILAECNENGIKIITYNDTRYPKVLKNISNPPICLYYKGSFPDFDNMPSVSLVGARESDDYSRKAAWSLSARLALAGFLIVSGGAVGIDTASHRGCLDVGGKTAAFLACGINYDYLKKSEALRKEISEKGCLISEFPPNYPVVKNAFQIRNRLISGISLGTVVISAGRKSGALITARSALEQGRDVFVITGKPDDEKYAGSNSLLRDGAIPVFEPTDIINEYINSFPNIIDVENSKNFNLSKLYKSIYTLKNNEKTLIESDNKDNHYNISKNFFENIKLTLSKNAEIVYNYINNDFFTVDDLAPTGISVGDIFTAVTELELEGLIKAVPGGRYIKNIKENDIV